MTGVTSYKDSIDYWHVVGLITNYYPYPVEFVEVTANFYSASGTLLATDTTFARMRAIVSGGSSPFEALEADVGGIGYVQVVITDFDDDIFFAIPSGLNPLITNTTVDIIDYGHIVGTVSNASSITWRFVEVIVALVRNGQVISVDTTFSKPSTLAPGQSATFEVLVSPHPGFDPVSFSGVSFLLYVDADD